MKFLTYKLPYIMRKACIRKFFIYDNRILAERGFYCFVGKIVLLWSVKRCDFPISLMKEYGLMEIYKKKMQHSIQNVVSFFTPIISAVLAIT
jgi:hypothetical protein